MNIIKIFIFLLHMHCAATTLLIAIEFFLDLGNGEVTKAVVLVGDLLRLTPREGPPGKFNKYEQKIDKLSRKLAEGRITSERFYDKVASYIESRKGGNEGRMPNKTPTGEELMAVLNNVFTYKVTEGEKTKVTFYHGVAYATKEGEIQKFTECRNSFDAITNCWRSSFIDDGRDFVQRLSVPRRIDAAGYGADSQALKTALSQYFNTKSRLTKTMDELMADIQNAYAQVYEIQKNLGTFYTSRSFSGLVINEQNGQSVQTDLDYYDPEEFPLAADEQLASMEAEAKNAEEKQLEDEEQGDFDPMPGPSESDAFQRLNQMTRSRIAAEAPKLPNFPDKFPNVPQERPSAPLATAEEMSEAEDVIERVAELAKQPSKVAVAEEMLQQRGWFIRLVSALKEFIRMFPRG